MHFVIYLIVSVSKVWQELRDFRGVNKVKKKLCKVAKNKIQARHKAMCSLRIAAAKKQNSLKQKKLSNKEAALTVDWSMQNSTSLGGLVYFKRKQPVRPLKPGETRFFKLVEKLPPAIQAVSRGHKWRSCIKDIRGKKRFECIWSERESSLFQTLDMGSASWGINYSLYDSRRGALGGYSNQIHLIDDIVIRWTAPYNGQKNMRYWNKKNMFVQKQPVSKYHNLLIIHVWKHKHFSRGQTCDEYTRHNNF